MCYYHMEIKLVFVMIKSSRVMKSVFKSSMILNQFNDKCKNTSQYQNVSTSIGIQCEKQNVISDYISQAVQYEQDYFSCGTQCNITTKTRGVQCSLDNFPVLFQSCSSQSNGLQCVSKSTQWCPEDTSVSSSFSQLCNHTETSGATDNSEYVTCSYPLYKQNVFPIENATSTSSKHPLNLEESQFTRKDLNLKQQQRLKSGKKNLSASTLFGSVIRQRNNTYASSSTSGVTEMFNSRSDLENAEDSVVSVELPVQEVKQKKHLWSAQESVLSISGSDVSPDFSSLYPEAAETFPKCKWRRSRSLSVQSRSKYSYDEKLTIVNYISQKNLYKQVRGVAMWQRMESEIEINRTWQSLKEHFRKKILPNINEFDLPKKIEESFHRIVMR